MSVFDHAGTDQLVLFDRAQALFASKLNVNQAHNQLNSILIFYGERPLTAEFFGKYLGIDAFSSNESLLGKIRTYQGQAMRLYGNFRRAFTRMSRVTKLSEELEPLEPRDISSFFQRSPFKGIQEIGADRLADLGYIAVQRIEQQNQDRHDASDLLRELANNFEKHGIIALSDFPSAKGRRLRTLLRKLESPLPIDEGLFSSLTAEALRNEANRIAPQKSDLTRIASTQNIALRNLGVYLSEPYMDVYVATSMREDADFQSVNNFVNQLFSVQQVKELNLRYFNPTQSWIEDRVAKGLVEALMLRRASVTVYMAQKSDTFGKDSEASVALGQGKAVIVYVPRLFDEDNGVDSEKTFRLDSSRLDEQLQKLNVPLEEGIDTKEKAKLLLRKQLEQLTAEQFKRAVWKHWADFDLMGEAQRIESKNLRAEVVKLINSISGAKREEDLGSILVETTPRLETIDRLVQTAERFESRAKTFRDIHPLSLQVIVRSGVVNGILVTRSVEDCARLLRAIIENKIETQVEVDDHNYRLLEAKTRSTLRVVSRHQLLTFAFWSQYFEEASQLPLAELPAAPL